MAEAVALGASVVAFIGIAGQIVQGCISISALIDDVKDAPSYLKNLRKEVKMMQSILEGFSRHLKDLEDTGIPLSDEQLTKEALALSKEAIGDLSQITSKYTQNIVAWNKFRFAMKKNSWQKSLAKIESAKNSLLTAQAFIILTLAHQQALDTQSTHRALGPLATTLDSSSLIVSSMPPILNEVLQISTQTNRELSKTSTGADRRLSDLITNIEAIRTSNFSVVTAAISEVNRKVEEVRHTTQELRAAIENMKSTSDALDFLPLGMSKMVKDTFRGVLAEFYLELSRTTKVYQTGEEQDGYLLSTSAWQDLRSTRRVLHQETHIRTYKREVGVITVRATTTKFHDYSTAIASPTTAASTVTQTHIEMAPNTNFIRHAVYFSLAQYGIIDFYSNPEPKLRVYNHIGPDAPIVKACQNGDLSIMRKLFKDKAASPFDRVEGRYSLLDIVISNAAHSCSRVMQTVKNETTYHTSKMFSFYTELLRLGLDPSGTPLDILATSHLESLYIISSAYLPEAPFQSEIADLARTILYQSILDPLQGNTNALTWLMHVDMPHKPINLLLQHQENWPAEWPEPDVLLHGFCLKITQYLQQDVEEYWDRGAISIKVKDYRRSDYEIEAPTLLSTVFFSGNPFLYFQILEGCYPLDKNLVLLLHLLNMSGQFSYLTTYPYIVQRLQKCIKSCLDLGLNVYQPPSLFLYALEFVSFTELEIIVRLALGRWEEQLDDDMQEADRSASLAYQLHFLNDYRGLGRECGGLAELTWVRIPYHSLLATDWTFQDRYQHIEVSTEDLKECKDEKQGNVDETPIRWYQNTCENRHKWLSDQSVMKEVYNTRELGRYRYKDGNPFGDTGVWPCLCVCYDNESDSESGRDGYSGQSSEPGIASTENGDECKSGNRPDEVASCNSDGEGESESDHGSYGEEVTCLCTCHRGWRNKESEDSVRDFSSNDGVSVNQELSSEISHEQYSTEEAQQCIKQEKIPGPVQKVETIDQSSSEAQINSENTDASHEELDPEGTNINGLTIAYDSFFT